MSKSHLNLYPQITRRDMLKAMGGCAAVTSTSMLSTLLNLKLTKSVMADVSNVSGYKALVCMFLFGGIDSANMLVPNDDDGYADYVAARGNLALDRDTLLPISDANGRQFGLHEGLADVQELYNNGDLSFIANVGTLIEPTTLAEYQARTNLPLGLFSHNDQQRHWQTSVPQSRSQITGWAGRMADCITDASNSNPAVSMNIALNSLNILQTGDEVVPYIVQNSGAQTLSGYGGGGATNRILTRVSDSLLQQTLNEFGGGGGGGGGLVSNLSESLVEQTYTDLLEKTHMSTRRSAIDAAVEFNDATSNVTLNTVFPASSIGQQLAMVARTIGASADLGQARNVFFVARGGWDHHDGLITRQEVMLPEIAAAMKAFNAAMVELNMHDRVTLFTASDFNRTLSTNGNGSDHAWGGSHIVMGGEVEGGTVHAQFPDSLAPGNSLDTGRGRLIPTTSVDEMAAELAMWFGVPNDGNLETILPNIRNFYSQGASSSPVGFMS